jgi:hypothetical protein
MDRTALTSSAPAAASPSLTVFSVANLNYEPFVVPYIASVLTHNSNAIAEVGVIDAEAYFARHGKAMKFLAERFPRERWKVRTADFGKTSPNALRFLEQPTLQSDYVYIGDIDILVLEEIAPFHMAEMAATGLPYSNMRRRREELLTGLHFSRWDAMYPHAALPEGTIIRSDEQLICSLMVAKGFALPPMERRIRPLHGFHLSPNRSPTALAWGLGRPELVDSYVQFRRGEMWRNLVPLLHPRYRVLLLLLDTALAADNPETAAEGAFVTGAGLRDIWRDLCAPRGASN